MALCAAPGTWLAGKPYFNEATAGIDKPVDRYATQTSSEHEAEEQDEFVVPHWGMLRRLGESHLSQKPRSHNVRIWLEISRAENYVDEINEYRDRNVANLSVSFGVDAIKATISGKYETWSTEWPLRDWNWGGFGKGSYSVPGEQLQLFRLAAQVLGEDSDYMGILDEEPACFRKCKAVMCTTDHAVFVPWAKSPAEPSGYYWWLGEGHPSLRDLENTNHDASGGAYDDDKIWGSETWRPLVNDMVSRWRDNGRKPLACIPPDEESQIGLPIRMLERVLHGIVNEAGSIQVISTQCHQLSSGEADGSALAIISPKVRWAASTSALTWSRTATPQLDPRETGHSFLDITSEETARAARPRALPTRVYDLLLDTPINGVTRQPCKGRYMALSYVWNEWSATDALAVARKAAIQADIRYIWLDKICINQADSSEKAAEIPRMADYYINAALVLILDRNFHIPEVVFATGTLTTPSRLRRWAEPCWRSIESSSWAQRVWTFQEGLCARNPVITNGHRGVSLQIIEAAMQPFPSSQILTIVGMKDNGFHRGGAGAIVPPERSNYTPRWTIGTFCRNWMDRWMTCSSPVTARPKLSLHAALRKTQGRNSTLAEDRIYGLLALIQGGEKVTIEYGIQKGHEAAWLDQLVRQLKDISLVGLEVMSAPDQAVGTGMSWMPKTFGGFQAAVASNAMCDTSKTEVLPGIGLVVRGFIVIVESRVGWRWNCRTLESLERDVWVTTKWEWEDMQGQEVLVVNADDRGSVFMLVRGHRDGGKRWLRTGIAIRAVINTQNETKLPYDTWNIC